MKLDLSCNGRHRNIQFCKKVINNHTYILSIKEMNYECNTPTNKLHFYSTLRPNFHPQIPFTLRFHP